MISENKLRLILFIAVAAVHGILIFFLVFSVGAAMGPASEQARIMKLTDIEEAPPPPPPPESEPETVVEAIAETMIETDVVPDQTVAAAGTLLPQSTGEDYLPMHLVSVPPRIDDQEIARSMVYPPIALRSNIEGRVILELFIDRTGRIQSITILQETPPGRGFGEAAVKAFEGKRFIPGEANGRPVSVRYRYPLRFTIK